MCKSENKPKILSYGEDALTLWALSDSNKMNFILSELKDNIDYSKCKIFYRPSFGRGGKGESNFGEFDFIIISSQRIYLGESKWWKSTERKTKSGEPILRAEQDRRFSILEKYIDKWLLFKKGSQNNGFKETWEDFHKQNDELVLNEQPRKTIPNSDNTILAKNLYRILKDIPAECNDKKNVKRIIFLFKTGVSIPVRVLQEKDNYIQIEINSPHEEDECDYYFRIFQDDENVQN